MGKSIDRNGFIQINIIVSDIEAAAEKWAQVLGVEKPEIRLMRLEGGENYTYRGVSVLKRAATVTRSLSTWEISGLIPTAPWAFIPEAAGRSLILRMSWASI